MKATGLLLLCLTLCLLVVQATEMPPCVCGGVQKAYLGDICNCGCVKEVDKGDYIESAWLTYVQVCNPAYIAALTAYFELDNTTNIEDGERFKNATDDVTDLWKQCKDDLDSIFDDCENCGANCTKYVDEATKKKEEDD
ncbi:hypothetical protein EDC96DRAFT_529962 [Choanephora cucurbitarum]|nr:hypothetical protein EDC96DRAFT_529962 [Choanephora cucurbitarum]